MFNKFCYFNFQHRIIKKSVKINLSEHQVLTPILSGKLFHAGVTRRFANLFLRG